MPDRHLQQFMRLARRRLELTFAKTTTVTRDAAELLSRKKT
jgi:hypothetical protein